MSRLIIAYHIIHISLYQYYTNNQTRQCSGRFQNIWENTCRHVSTWCHPLHLPNCLKLIAKAAKKLTRNNPKKGANEQTTCYSSYFLLQGCLIVERPSSFFPSFRAVVKHLSVVVRMAVRCYAPASESSWPRRLAGGGSPNGGFLPVMVPMKGGIGSI